MLIIRYDHRFLGHCPECKAVDTIVGRFDESHWGRSPRAEHPPMICEECSSTWETESFNAVRDLIRTNRLFEVCVKSMPTECALDQPCARDVPFGRFISQALNTAVLVRFPKLGVGFSTEGGIRGCNRGEYVELRNCFDEIGLWLSDSNPGHPGVKQVMDWYTELFRLVFIDRLIIGDLDMGRAPVLKLDASNVEHVGKLSGLLFLCFRKKTGSDGFARAVMERMQQLFDNPFASRYLAGPTEEDILKLFISLR